MTEKSVECQFCGKKLAPMGVASHEAACKENPKNMVTDEGGGGSPAQSPMHDGKRELDPRMPKTEPGQYQVPGAPEKPGKDEDADVPPMPGDSDLKLIYEDEEEDMGELPPVPKPPGWAPGKHSSFTPPIMLTEETLNFLLYSYGVKKRIRAGILWDFLRGKGDRASLDDSMKEYGLPPKVREGVLRKAFGFEDQDGAPVAGRRRPRQAPRSQEEVEAEIEEKMYEDTLKEYKRLRMQKMINEMKQSVEGGNGHGHNGHGQQTGVSYEYDKEGNVKRMKVLGAPSPYMPYGMMPGMQFPGMNTGPSERERKLEEDVKVLRDKLEHNQLLGQTKSMAKEGTRELLEEWGVPKGLGNEPKSDMDVLTTWGDTLTNWGVKFGSDGSSGASNRWDVESEKLRVMGKETDGKFAIGRQLVENMGRKTDKMVEVLEKTNNTLSALAQNIGQPPPQYQPPPPPPEPQPQPQYQAPQQPAPGPADVAAMEASVPEGLAGEAQVPSVPARSGSGFSYEQLMGLARSASRNDWPSLEDVARQVGIQDPDNKTRYPNKDSLAKAILGQGS